MGIPPFRDVQPRLADYMRGFGGLGVVVVDIAPLGRIERNFGGSAYLALRSQIDPLMEEAKAHVREDDTLTRDERDPDRFLFFLTGRRKTKNPFQAVDLHRLCDRVEAFLTPRVARLTFPYTREKGTVDVGYGFVLWSPLESEERQITRAVAEARSSAELRRSIHDRDQREGLIELVHNRTLWTAFQPIVEMESRAILAHEALSRGPRGTDMEPPYTMFGLAARYDLTDQLERACRRQAFVDWERFGLPGRLFINTVPATVRDQTFLGRGVLDYLGPRMSPSLVTLELTERQVIENLNMYREAMHAFLDLGFTFAIDDLGAGYSGLETVSRLPVSYLKIDMSLVRDIHVRKASQQIVKAIFEMGQSMGATMIAEGIQTPEEMGALQALGLRYGQGYLFSRPIDPYAAAAAASAKAQG